MPPSSASTSLRRIRHPTEPEQPQRLYPSRVSCQAAHMRRSKTGWRSRRQSQTAYRPYSLVRWDAWSSSAHRLFSPEGVETSHWGNAPRRARRLNPALCLRLAAITLHDSTALGSQQPRQRQTAYPAETSTSQQVAPYLCSARRESTALHRGVNARFHLAVHPRACRPAWPIAVVSTAKRVYDGAQRACLSSV